MIAHQTATNAPYRSHASLSACGANPDATRAAASRNEAWR